MSEAPHRGGEALQAGARLEAARAAVVLLHGRGAGAADILGLAALFTPRPEVIFLAPQAAGASWYPRPFLAPIDLNQPWLDSALELTADILRRLESASISPGSTMLLGFSQGACLALEFAARHPRRYGAVVAFSGGLIGPPGEPLAHDGDQAGTPIFLGCGDVDPHIPAWRVEESGRVLASMGAAVDLRLYSGLGHTVNADEIEAADQLLAGLVDVGRP